MKISIVITAYNCENTLRAAVESVLNQTCIYPSSPHNVEIIIVEDASTDGTRTLAATLAAAHRSIRLITHPKNLGAGWGRRHGIEAAKGDYILTLDADDTLSNHFLASLIARAEETDADIVAGGITFHRTDGATREIDYGNGIDEGYEKIDHYFADEVKFLNNKLVRRTLYDRVPYCTRRYIEDTPTIFPLLYHANRVAYVSNLGYHYYQNPASLTNTATPLKDLIYKALCIIDLLEFFADKEPRWRGKDENGALILTPKLLLECVQAITRLQPTIKELLQYGHEYIIISYYIQRGLLLNP